MRQPHTVHDLCHRRGRGRLYPDRPGITWLRFGGSLPDDVCFGVGTDSLGHRDIIQFVATENGDYYQCEATGSYGTAQGAAAGAIDCQMGKSQAWGQEIGGAVVPNGHGAYTFTSVTQGNPIAVLIPQAPDALAIYHTHPYWPGYISEQFSPRDIETAQGALLPSYLGTAQGRIEVFTPTIITSNGVHVLATTCVLVGPPLGGTVPVNQCH